MLPPFCKQTSSTMWHLRSLSAVSARGAGILSSPLSSILCSHEVGYHATTLGPTQIFFPHAVCGLPGAWPPDLTVPLYQLPFLGNQITQEPGTLEGVTLGNVPFGRTNAGSQLQGFFWDFGTI